MEDLSHLLRDHHSGEQIAIEVGVVDFLAAVMDGVGASRATVLSAYRTVATNRMLAKTTFGVADNSQHLYGRALDIHFGSRLEDAMRAARGMQRGGVGWYPRSGSSISIAGRCATGPWTAPVSTGCFHASSSFCRAAVCRITSSPTGPGIRSGCTTG